MSAAAACAGSAFGARTEASTAALQVALRAHGQYGGAIDGVDGPLTQAGIVSFQRRKGLTPDGQVSHATRRALGRLGRPLLGQRELWVGRRGWDVAALEFRLVRYGLPPRAVDGRFTEQTGMALRAFQARSGLVEDGIAGVATFRALARGSGPAPAPQRVHVVEAGDGFIVIARRYGVTPAALAAANGLTLRSVISPGQRLVLPAGAAAARPALADATHLVRPGEGWFVIAQRYGVSPYELAAVNDARLDSLLVPDQRLRLPAGARTSAASAGVDVPHDVVRGLLDRWAVAYGVDARLARALAWMESGFQQSVVSDIGALGIMQLMPETWDWVDSYLIGQPTARTAQGNVQAGVRFLRWQLDQFGGNVDLALAGWYQGARAVREIGIYDDTKQFVSVVRALYGKV